VLLIELEVFLLQDFCGFPLCYFKVFYYKFDFEVSYTFCCRSEKTSFYENIRPVKAQCMS